MADVNHVVLVGRLTRDAELKYTPGGAAVCKFSLAINRRRKNGEEWTEEVNFFDIVLWGRQGEALNQYLVKGKQVAVEGELRQNRWEQDGQPRSKIEIIANNLQRSKIHRLPMPVMMPNSIIPILILFHFKENRICPMKP